MTFKSVLLLWDLINAIITPRRYSKMRMCSKARNEQSLYMTALDCWKGQVSAFNATGTVVVQTLLSEPNAHM